jgi:predicted DNA-binding protein
MGGIRIAYLITDANLLPDVEKALIQHFNPPLNWLKKTKTGSTKKCSADPIRYVLAESGSSRIRVSVEARQSLDNISAESGKPVWLVIDQMLGVQ